MTGAEDKAVQLQLMTQLVAIRKARGLKTRQVARRLHVTPPAVSRFEHSVANGRSPTLRAILRYADAIGAQLTVAERSPR
jgi:transcriptional regulator with XRE-family HTH domain